MKKWLIQFATQSQVTLLMLQRSEQLSAHFPFRHKEYWEDVYSSGTYKISPFFCFVRWWSEICIFKETLAAWVQIQGTPAECGVAALGMRTSGFTHRCFPTVNVSTWWKRRTMSLRCYRNSFDFLGTRVWALTGAEDHTLRTTRLVMPWKQMTTKCQGLTPQGPVVSCWH